LRRHDDDVIARTDDARCRQRPILLCDAGGDNAAAASSLRRVFRQRSLLGEAQTGHNQQSAVFVDDVDGGNLVSFIEADAAHAAAAAP
jgi:hypothetical protein